MAVLIVDDRPAGRAFHRRWLQAQAAWPDSAFLECRNLDQAILAANGVNVDMVVLDLNLDRTDFGIATLKRFLRETRVPATKIYVTTADSDNFELVSECEALGVADVSNASQPPWAQPPRDFSAAQLAELQRQISAEVSKVLSEKMAAEFAILTEEAEKRDKLKQAEGILIAMRVVAGVLATALGTWLLSFAPLAVKALILSMISGGKSQ